MIGWGYKAQRFAHDLLKKFAKKQTKAPPSTHGRPPVREQVIHFVNKKMPGNLPKKAARALLDIEDDKFVPIIRDPCHSPMKQQDPIKTVNSLMTTVGAQKIEKNDRCCGESGTLAVARPDVSTQIRFRKEAEMRKGADKLRADGFKGDIKILTSCLQGLSRFNDDSDTDADYIVVEMARHLLGPNWMPDYVARANNGGIERVQV